LIGLRSDASGGALFSWLTIHLIHVYPAPLTDREGMRKSRVGAWRLLFTVNREAKRIYILTLDTRGQVYKRS
jgi:mRNA-degrading endonuclease RelE of RelBE toxin-antitoxin system